MNVSIIIPSYNTKSLLERCLASVYASLKQAKFSYEVTVVDNASIDGSPEMVSKKFTQVHLLRNKVNLGYGKANNIIIKNAKGKYILLLNSDIVVQNDAIGLLYRLLQEKKNAFAGGKLLNEDGSPQPSCGPFYTLPMVMLLLFARGDHWGVTRYSPNAVTSVDWVSGACLMGRKDAFMKVGLFDERIFMYMEEIDFLYRAKKKGYEVFFEPKAHFTHSGAASSRNKRTPVVNIYRGLLYFYRKHYSPLALAAVRFILKMKALAAIALGRMIGRWDIASIYEEALSVV